MARKWVTIILNPDSSASVDEPKAHVSKKAQDEITWICPQGEASIQFIGGSPFKSERFSVPYGGSVSSGPAREDAELRSYKYSIVARNKFPGDQRTYVADPEVIVEG